jgi:hypothetical protein
MVVPRSGRSALAASNAWSVAATARSGLTSPEPIKIVHYQMIIALS